MDAGVLAYRLCNRGYACEHCPLDAALRDDPRVRIAGDEGDEGGATGLDFPADRLYTRNHHWIQRIRDSRVRTGLDAFAARILGRVGEVRTPTPGATVTAGQPCVLVSVEGGLIRLASPVSGRVLAVNPRLGEHPELLGTQAYSGGWLMELALPPGERGEGLLSPGSAVRQARADARRVCRRLGMHLLTVEGDPGPWLHADSTRSLRRSIGPEAWFSLAIEALR
jgi:glycine cleavage system H protein